MSRATGKQDLEQLMKEVQEARRIKMLHQPSKVYHLDPCINNTTFSFSGATKSVYAPKQLDVGRILQVDIIIPQNLQITLSTTGEIDPAAGLGTYVEALVRKHDTEFNVRHYNSF
ncbi:hypothetical protein PIB30_064156 [Stylosanthes scabra]|uniref:Uncharacterized protein n=1 Tax=Stylosanthes scabra TaxID=79078 RepID=A0ABU6VK22_9FABA|nr:hypothetical protein [Stylosanthes scabra]